MVTAFLVSNVTGTIICSLPIHYLQAGNSVELIGVMSYENQPMRQCNCCYHQIVWPNWRT